jgi:hypothetical protein
MPPSNVVLKSNPPSVQVFTASLATALGVLFTLTSQGALAQNNVFRCPGNEYTNDEAKAKSLGCKVIQGAAVTIVSAPQMPKAPAASPAAKPAGSGAATASNTRTDSAEQRARDSDARLILEGELKKTEEKLADLKREFNNGEPEKRGEEFRNHQRYLDRVADLKSAIARTETDVSSLKREIGRLPGSSSAAPGAGSAAVAPLTAPSR